MAEEDSLKSDELFTNQIQNNNKVYNKKNTRLDENQIREMLIDMLKSKTNIEEKRRDIMLEINKVQSKFEILKQLERSINESNPKNIKKKREGYNSFQSKYKIKKKEFAPFFIENNTIKVFSVGNIPKSPFASKTNFIPVNYKIKRCFKSIYNFEKVIIYSAELYLKDENQIFFRIYDEKMSLIIDTNIYYWDIFAKKFPDKVSLEYFFGYKSTEIQKLLML